MVKGPAALKMEGIYQVSRIHQSRTPKRTAYLRRSGQAAVHPQIPDGLIVDSGQVLGDGDGHGTVLLGNVALDLDALVEFEVVQVARGVVVQPHGVGFTGVLGQRIVAVGGGRAVELQVNLGTGADGGVVGDALEDIDAGVITLAPGW